MLNGIQTSRILERILILMSKHQSFTQIQSWYNYKFVGGVILPFRMLSFIGFHNLSCSKCMSIIFKYQFTSYKSK